MMNNDYLHEQMVQDLLGRTTRIFFRRDESNVKNNSLISYGGIEGTIKIIDISSLPSNLGQRAVEKMLDQMGDKMPVIATARFQCESREMGDMKLDILSMTGDVVLSIKRNKRLGLLWLADGDKEIPARFSDGTTAAVLRVSKNGGASVEIDVAGEEGLYFRRWIPAWQAQTKWLLCAFLCFLPTAGLAGCFGFYKAFTSDIVSKMKKHSLGTVIDLDASLVDMITFDGISSWKEKLTILCLGAFMFTDKLTEKPVNHQAGIH
jgi:hypothetical protein